MKDSGQGLEFGSWLSVLGIGITTGLVTGITATIALYTTDNQEIIGILAQCISAAAACVAAGVVVWAAKFSANILEKTAFAPISRVEHAGAYKVYTFFMETDIAVSNLKKKVYEEGTHLIEELLFIEYYRDQYITARDSWLPHRLNVIRNRVLSRFYEYYREITNLEALIPRENATPKEREDFKSAWHCAHDQLKKFNKQLVEFIILFEKSDLYVPNIPLKSWPEMVHNFD